MSTPAQDGTSAHVLWRVIRGTWRLCAIVACTLGLSALWFTGLPFHRSPARRRAWRRRIFGSWARRCLSTLAVRVELRGVAPEAPCFLVTNHSGWLEVLALAAELDCIFVSMIEIRGWPIVGRMARAFDTILIDRDKRRDIPAVNREIEAAIARGERVVFFPEGRTTHGARVERFQPALFEPAARSGTPVGCAAVYLETSERDRPAARVLSLADQSFLAYARGLLALDSARVEIVFGAGVVRGDDRKELARLTHERVSELFRPLAGSDADSRTRELDSRTRELP